MAASNREHNNMTADNREHNNERRYKLSVAIDFGTTTSAMAYSYYEKQHEIHVFTDYSDGLSTSAKIPTAILFDRNKKFVSFGNNALSHFEEYVDKDEHKDVYLFKNFKMCLYEEKNITQSMLIEDIAGKQMLSIDVFTAAFKFFQNTILDDMKKRNELLKIEEHDIRWVITVPAIWGDKAKEFMRKAAEKAGFSWRGIKIALEPEVAAIWCYSDNRLEMKKEGTKYLVIDIGGGTLDITSQQIEKDGSIKEIYKASGNDLGGVKVDDEFEKLLQTLFSVKNFENLKRDSPDEYINIMQDFQDSKRKLNLDSIKEISVNVAIGLFKTYFKTLGDEEKQGAYLTKKGKLFIPKDKVNELIKLISRKISLHIESLLKENRELNDLNHIIIVGGFSNSVIVVNDIKNLTKMPVHVPEQAELCVVKGACLFGWKDDAIVSRRSKKTYGLAVKRPFIEGKHDEKRAEYTLSGEKRCVYCFRKLVTINEEIRLNHTVHYSGTHSKGKGQMDHTSIKLYATDKSDPMYSNEDGVMFIGKICIPRPEEAIGKSIRITAYFGHTEIRVKAFDEYSGKTFEGNFTYLSDNALKVA